MPATDNYHKNINILGTILLVLFLMPLWLFIIWNFFPKKKMVLAVVDKTVLTKAGQEHVSLNWVLLQEKYSKTKKDLYKHTDDYFGFFPELNKNFSVKGLERFSTPQLDKLSDDADLAYFTDAYGIYRNEWYAKGDEKERSGIIYGGMSEQDIDFLAMMKNKHKLIISEFNCLGSPTSKLVSAKFQEQFGIGWSGWIGRYFDSFDTTSNKELPKWVVRNYKAQNNGKWPFKKAGIVLVHSDDRIVILEKDNDLVTEFPEFQANEEGQKKYKLPESFYYTFWFDIVESNNDFNHTIANFVINTTNHGTELLAKNGIPASFPAISLHRNNDYKFFYFSADFSDNPIELNTAYLKYVPYFRKFMYNRQDPMDRKATFWEIYQPLVTTILNDYHQEINQRHLGK